MAAGILSSFNIGEIIADKPRGGDIDITFCRGF